MSEENKTVLQIQNTQSALDVVFQGVTIDRQVPDHIITTGVTLDQVLLIDKTAGALTERILREGGYVAFPSHAATTVSNELLQQYGDRIMLSEHPYAKGTRQILETHPEIKSGRIQRVLLHTGAAYERGNMADQDIDIRGIAIFVSNEDLPDQPYVRMVTGRSADQMLVRPYAAAEEDPADRLDQGMLSSFGMLLYTNKEGQQLPNYLEDGAVLLRKAKEGRDNSEVETELNLLQGVDGQVMTGLIQRLNSMLTGLNEQYAAFTDNGKDPFYIPVGKQTRFTLNLPKALRNDPKRAEVEAEIIKHITKYATNQGAAVTDKRTYQVR
ncbi:hypothetical protein HYY69_05230 [Candidatus Woesearchaeota archaeon]|nr:hypothetical protein [Candidatus Woesearchaeota archaeon]